MRNTSKTLLLLFAVCLGAGPVAGQGDSASRGNAAVPERGVVIAMEGTTHRLRNINWRDSSVTFADGEIRFYLTEDDNPISLNFNLSDSAILDTGAGVYVLPEANRGPATIDLNFFNANREGSRTRRRIVFNEGTIEIQTLTRNSLTMTFKGSGQPLTDRNRFPIEGSVNVTF